MGMTLSIYKQIDKHIMEDEKPSIFLNRLLKSGDLKAYPFSMLSDLVRVRQSPQHHPEGNVWNHTMLVLDLAAKYKNRSRSPRVFMWAALLHDLGKVPATKVRKGKITAYNHDKLGVGLAADFLREFNEEPGFISRVTAMVRWHMQILFLVKDLPFADTRKMLKELPLEEIALLGYCDRMGRGKMTSERIRAEEENIRIFTEKGKRVEEELFGSHKTDRWQIAALGELLIDFTPSGTSAQGGAMFERNPGGAPANVLAAAAKLGLSTAFIGKVGQDPFGYFLKDTLIRQGIDTEGLIFTKEANTTLAFVHLDEKGERSFSFYRSPGADMLLTEHELKGDIIENSIVFHFGSVSMTHEPARTATLKAAEMARDAGKLVSYDPNLRPPLWASLKEAKNVIQKGLPYTDILKISEEELEFLCDTGNLEAGSELLYKKYGIPIILITLGPDGCFYRRQELTGRCPGYKAKAVDTTGAGDAFLGGFLYKFLSSRRQISELDEEAVTEAVSFANAMGALTVTRKGAIPAIPSLEEVNKLIES